MELIHAVSPRQIKIAVFDFDGTLSLLRTGWQQTMVDLMSEVLSAAAADVPTALISLPDLTVPRVRHSFQRDSPEFTAYLRNLVDNSTGRQTIDQMLMLAQLENELAPHGGKKDEERFSERALQLKVIYLARLEALMSGRLESLRSDSRMASDLLIGGAADFLAWLDTRDVKLCLISGTDRASVVAEANLLGIGDFFGDRIFGGLDVTGAFTKYRAMQQVIAREAADKSQVVTFGDGIMDVRSAADVGALAVGVASDETKQRPLDPVKRRQLIDAGADAIIGDYRRFPEWIGQLMV